MREVNITEFRNHFPAYIHQVREGRYLNITSHGKIIARLVPAEDRRERSQELLANLRKKCWIGDVVSPVGEKWEAEDDHS